jgi:hypothetical protein
MRTGRFLLVFVMVSCGGKAKGPEPLARADELKKDKVVEPEADAGVTAVPIAAPPPTEPVKPAPPPAAAATFELKNDGDGDLVFTTTKGWQPVLFAYTGKPPKAKTVFLFETACTASCDAGDNVCPVCPAPKNKKEELAMAKTETAAAGKSILVPWDGKTVVYEKAPNGRNPKTCKCFTKADPPPDSYTIKACGLRASKVAGKPSKAVCTETTLALPLQPGQTVSLSFK